MLRSVTSVGGLAAMALLIGCGGVEAAASGRPPKHWAPLDPAAVMRLYSGRTWRWKDGTAYFAPDGRFKAWTRAKGELSEGIGTWEARPDGVMCFDASWRTVSKTEQQASPNVETCFRHEARGTAIAQMKLPNGAWYFFRHPKPSKTDEFFKLQAGDRTRPPG